MARDHRKNLLDEQMSLSENKFNLERDRILKLKEDGLMSEDQANYQLEQLEKSSLTDFPARNKTDGHLSGTIRGSWFVLGEKTGGIEPGCLVARIVNANGLINVNLANAIEKFLNEKDGKAHSDIVGPVSSGRMLGLINKFRSYALTSQNNFFWKYEKNYIL